MNVHLKFILLFAIMGLIIFGSCFVDKGDSRHFNIPTISYMAFQNIYVIPAIFGGLTFGFATLLYGLSYWWGKWAFNLIKFIREDLDNKKKGG